MTPLEKIERASKTNEFSFSDKSSSKAISIGRANFLEEIKNKRVQETNYEDQIKKIRQDSEIECELERSRTKIEEQKRNRLIKKIIYWFKVGILTIIGIFLTCCLFIYLTLFTIQQLGFLEDVKINLIKEISILVLGSFIGFIGQKMLEKDLV